jgi:uncharacterized membrane protein YhaH (DUF805 family)
LPDELTELDKIQQKLKKFWRTLLLITSESRWSNLLRSDRGRIGRQEFWLGFIILALLPVLIVRLGPMLWNAWPLNLKPAVFNPSLLLALLVFQIAVLALMPLVALIVFYLVLGYPYFWYCVFVKRLHDRGKPDWPALVVLFLGWAGLIFASTVGVMNSESPLFNGPQLAQLAENSSRVCLTLAVIVLAWLLAELGFLQGTPGPNRYGDDPLQTSSVNTQ